MFEKPHPPRSLRMLQVLSCRKKLNSKEEMRRLHLQRGLEGELKFYTLLQDKLKSPCIPLYNLRLAHNMNEFQIDCLLIFRNEIHLIDVKNYHGDFSIDDSRWYYAAKMDEIKNPLDQLTRCEMLLKAFLKQRNINLPVVPNLFFMNPAFYLYGAELSMPIIFPGQHERYLKKLNTMNQPFDVFHEQIASDLTSAHIVQSRHEYVPEYQYDDLSNGIFCKGCSTGYIQTRKKYFMCGNCGMMETTEKALLRTIQEFQLLFHNRMLTVEAMLNWTGGAVSKSTIRRYLTKHFTQCSRGRGTYYC